MDPEVFRAASSGDSSFFENLPSSECSPFQQLTTERNTVLHIALQFKQFDTAEKIVNLSSPLAYEGNCRDNTPLHVAAMVGASSFVKILIQKAKRADSEQLLSMANCDGNTALHVAVRYGNFDVVTELINGNVPAQLAMQVNKAGESALFLAVDRQEYGMAFYILGAAPECSYAGRHGMNVLHAVVLQTTSNYINMVDWISQTNFKDLEFKFQRGILTLKWIISMLFLNPLPESLTQRTIKRRIRRARAVIPEDFVKEVMKKCPSTIEQRDDSGWTPLHIAAHMGNRKFVKQLLEKGNSHAYLRNREGLSAFHIAAKEGNVGVMKVIIMACPGIYELLDNRGKTALHVSAENGARDAVMFFLTGPEFVGLINEQDNDGNTPLHLAAINRNYEVLSLLGHKRGVDLHAKNNEGFTIMDIVFQTKEDYMHTDIWNLDPSGRVKLAGVGDGDGNGKGKEGSNFVKQVSETNLLVATLIATVTFTAAFTVPGGFNQNGGVDEGLAVLSKKTAFRVFLIANTIAFGLSTTSIFVNFLASMTSREVDFHREVLRRAPIFTNWSIGALLVAFTTGTYTVVPHFWGITVGLILCCCFLISLLFPLLIK